MSAAGSTAAGRPGSAVLDRIAAARIVPVVDVPEPGPRRRWSPPWPAGGLDVVEVTLRTPDALDALRLATRVQGVLVGAGTVMTAGQAVAAAEAGAQFVVSPGLHVEVVHACQDLGVLAIPGVGHGHRVHGGPPPGSRRAEGLPGRAARRPALRPRPGLAGARACGSCPPAASTATARRATWPCRRSSPVGGSWMATAEHVAAGDWAAVERAAADCRVVGRDPADR
jgi:2-dehydro-3-deoxyphosphogluconate aldolase/(4S)-4-hydroxy-2-oxoglutarate aldolase